MKRTIIGILLLIVIGAGRSWADPVQNGDVNNNGIVNVADIMAIASHLYGSTPEGFVADVADVNNSGSITVADILVIANIIYYGTIDIGTTIHDWTDGNGGGEDLTQEEGD